MVLRLMGLWLLGDAIASLVKYRGQPAPCQGVRGIRAVIGFLLLTGGYQEVVVRRSYVDPKRVS